MRFEPWMFDFVIAGVASEFLLLAFLLTRAGRTPWAWPLFWFLLSGALLMAAVRSTLEGLPHPVIGGILIVSLLTHAACLRSAWRLVAAKR